MPQTEPVLVVDTREKLPWALPFETVRTTLPTGDYTLRGVDVVIERKSAGDLVQTVIHDFLRFRKELYRLAAFDCAVIAVECDIADIIEHRYESDASPDSVLGRCNACLLDHGVPCVFWGARPHAVHMAERFLRLAWKKYGC